MQRVLRIPNGIDPAEAYVPTHPSLSKLLRAERAAALTYELAMRQCAGAWTGDRFAELCGSHASNAQALDEHCEVRSSPWHDAEEGPSVETVVSPTAHRIAMLQNLELELAVAYHRALQDASLPQEVRDTIGRTLLPTVREHLVVLAELLLQE
jgi:hypothetical protein